MWRKEDVINKLKEDQGKRSLRAYAQTIGCSAAYLSKVYNNIREPGRRLLDHFGLEKQVEVVKTITYQPKKKWRKDE